jgi:arsenate reductase
MSEAFAKRYAGEKYKIESAGLEPGEINPYTIRVMEEIGYDMSGHRSKSVREFMGHTHSRYVITVCGNADKNCPHGLWSTGTKLHWPFEDPAAFIGSDEEKMNYFRKIRDQIHHKVKLWLDEISFENENTE